MSDKSACMEPSHPLRHAGHHAHRSKLPSRSFVHLLHVSARLVYRTSRDDRSRRNKPFGLKCCCLSFLFVPPVRAWCVDGPRSRFPKGGHRSSRGRRQVVSSRSSPPRFFEAHPDSRFAKGSQPDVKSKSTPESKVARLKGALKVMGEARTVLEEALNEDCPDAPLKVALEQARGQARLRPVNECLAFHRVCPDCQNEGRTTSSVGQDVPGGEC